MNEDDPDSEWLTQEEVAQLAVTADQVIDLLIDLDRAIDSDDEAWAGRIAAEVRRVVGGVDADWFSLITQDDRELAIEVAQDIALCFDIAPDATTDDLYETVFWCGAEAELSGGFDKLSSERAADIVMIMFRLLVSLSADAPNPAVWEVAREILAARAFWPDFSEIGGHGVALTALARTAAIAADLDTAGQVFAEAEASADQKDLLIQVDLMSTRLHLNGRRGRTDELRRLLPEAFTLARRSGSDDLMNIALSLAVGAEMTAGLHRSMDDLLAALDRIGAPRHAVETRAELMRSWPRAGAIEAWIVEADTRQLESIAARTDPTADPGPHIAARVMLAQLYTARGDHTSAEQAIEQARASLTKIESISSGGALTEGFTFLIDLAEAALMNAANRRPAAVSLLSGTRQRVLRHGSWMMAAIATTVLALCSPAESPATLQLDVEAMVLTAGVRDLLPSSVERSDARTNLSMIVAVAFDHADRQGDPRVVAELIELARAQAMPISTVTPDDSERSLVSLITSAAVTQIAPIKPDEADELYRLVPPGRILMPWGESDISRTVTRIDALMNRPPAEDAAITLMW